MRYKLTIEYDGGPYVGWQRQENGPSVQQALEEAIAAFTGETVTVRGAGRTDAGVHALGQVAHIELTRDWRPDQVRDAINAFLKTERISVLASEAVGDDFDSRFSATYRRYLYRICNRRAPPTVDEGRVWWVAIPLDADAMHEAAQSLTGTHDFTTFRATECQAKSPLRTLDSLAVARRGDEIEVTAGARSFLHNQVRSLVGSLKLVGEGRWSTRDLVAALEARDRKGCGPVAPAEGLYLVSVDYGDPGSEERR